MAYNLDRDGGYQSPLLELFFLAVATTSRRVCGSWDFIDKISQPLVNKIVYVQLLVNLMYMALPIS